jgi:hypothetical protein
MMTDDAEIDEEIERQLEADAQDRNYIVQPLLDDKDLDVSEDFAKNEKKILLKDLYQFLLFYTLVSK